MGSWVTLAQSFAPQASVSQKTWGKARVVRSLGQRDLPEEQVRVGCWVDGGRATGRMGSPVLQACARPGGRCWLKSSHKPRSGGQYPPSPHAAHRWGGGQGGQETAPGSSWCYWPSRYGAQVQVWGAQELGEKPRDPGRGPQALSAAHTPTWPLGLSFELPPSILGAQARRWGQGQWGSGEPRGASGLARPQVRICALEGPQSGALDHSASDGQAGCFYTC